MAEEVGNNMRSKRKGETDNGKENYRRGKEAGHCTVANKRRSERRSVQVQPGERCSYPVEMKRLVEG